MKQFGWDILLYFVVIFGLSFLYGDRFLGEGPVSTVKFIYQEF